MTDGRPALADAAPRFGAGGADAPFRLFAIARGVGWAAHAIEQSASGAVIRPRALYQGLAADDLGRDR